VIIKRKKLHNCLKEEDDDDDDGNTFEDEDNSDLNKNEMTNSYYSLTLSQAAFWYFYVMNGCGSSFVPKIYSDV
jgi:hypothetical protein